MIQTDQMETETMDSSTNEWICIGYGRSYSIEIIDDHSVLADERTGPEMSLGVFRPYLSDLVITWYVIRIQSQTRTDSQSPFRGFHVPNVELNFITNTPPQVNNLVKSQLVRRSLRHN